MTALSHCRLLELTTPTDLCQRLKWMPAFLLLLLPASVQAQFSYTTNNSAITITGYTGPGGAVVIPDTITSLPVTTIGSLAFYNKASLRSVTIPDSVTNIGNYAFQFCANLTNVTIGVGVTSIGISAFSPCISLRGFTVDAANPAYSSLQGVLFDKTQTTLITFPGGKSDSFTFPNSVTSIGDYGFYFCGFLVSVTLPNSVTSIGDHAFQSCGSLASVTTGNGVTNIGDRAFSDCQFLTNATIGNAVTRMGDYVFSNCPRLTGATIPDSVTSIGEWAFYYCTRLTSVVIGNGLTNIGPATFSYCTNLTSVMIGNSVTSIGFGAFTTCTSLTNITIPNGVTNIGQYAFEACSGLTNVTIGSGVINIGSTAFSRCSSLTGITVDAANAAYSGVDGVVLNKNQTTLILCPGGKSGSYTTPNSVTSIGSYAFYYCGSLTSVTIPNGVTSIGIFAFQYCATLTIVTIGDGVTSIGSSAFVDCISLTNISVGAANTAYSSVDGVLFNKAQTALITFPGGRAGGYTIPTSVTSIVDRAFASCASLTGVYFRGNVPSLVGVGVFAGANNVTVYYLPGTTGWGATFAGRPTVLWNPTVPTSDPTFGVQANQYGFTITGTDGLVIVVEAATDIANPVWSPVGTNTLAGGSSYFSDPNWTGHPARYYRLRSP